MPSSAAGLTRFNVAPDLAERLAGLGHSALWGRRLASWRPYASVRALVEANTMAVAELPTDELRSTIAAHPRIGEATTPGSDSEREQAAAAADPEVVAEIGRLNAEYEDRFGHRYLVAAAGRTAADIRDDLVRRLGHDARAELGIARCQLTVINRGRLERLLVDLASEGR